MQNNAGPLDIEGEGDRWARWKGGQGEKGIPVRIVKTY